MDWSRAEEPSTTFWHKEVDCRILLMLSAAGGEAFHRPGIHGEDASDYREPDLGVVAHLPPDAMSRWSLPGSAFSLVVEIFPDGDEGARWYARRGIPEYWTVDQRPVGGEDDARVRIHRLKPDKSSYVWERSLLLSELEAEYRAG